MHTRLTPDDVRWVPAGEAPGVGKRCPVCGTESDHIPLLDVPSMLAHAEMLRLFRCGRCRSLFYDPPDIADFGDHEGDQEAFWRFYVEVGGGVWETIWPILAAARDGSLLDVGCGFGFALDFWQRAGRGEAVGLELAGYGRRGAAMLGVTIHGELLQHCAALAGRRFDVVYASEVIEHVPDPGAFVALLAPWVADDGVLIMTTPAASFIAPENQSTTMLAALAPGLHGFLLSADAFVAAVRSAGFTFVEQRTFQERQFVWASRRPLQVMPQTAAAREAYLAYLDKRVIGPHDIASPVWQGLAYRYAKELINAGRLGEAKEIMSALGSTLTSCFGPDIVDPAAVLARIRASATLEEYGQSVPFFMPSLFFFLGMLAQHTDRDADLALRAYAGAADCALESARFGALFFLEALSLLWPARARHAELRLARGEIADGVTSLLALAEQGDRCDARNGYALASRELVETTVPQWCELLWSHGRRDDARALFAAHRRYLCDRYGSEVLDAAAVAAALANRQRTLPLDPLYGAFFVARQGLPAPEAQVQLVDIGRIAERHADDASLGPRLRELAQRARQLVTAAPSATAAIWSSSAHFKQPLR